MNQLGGKVHRLAQRFDQPLTSGQVEALVQFLELLQKWGRSLRLTSDPTPEVLIERHLPDALVLARLLNDLPSAPETAVDVGSGAGLPALPLAILCDKVSLNLVESRSRRCSFLQTAIHKLELGQCRVINGRIEQMTLPRADLALSRATFPPPVWLEIGAGLVREAGLVALLCTSVNLAPEQVRAPVKLERIQFQHYTVGSNAPRVAALYRCFT